MDNWNRCRRKLSTAKFIRSAAVAVVIASLQPTASVAADGPPLVLRAPLRVVPATSGGGVVAVAGGAAEAAFADASREVDGQGIVLRSAEKEGSATWQVTGLDAATLGRWYTFRIRALAQERFRVAEDDFHLRVEFLSAGGSRPLDQITKKVYEQVERERADLVDKGTNRSLGAATWRNYATTFRLPFPEIDTVRLSVGFTGGGGDRERSELWIGEVELAAVPEPAEYVRPPNVAASGPPAQPPALEAVVPLGGRWYFDPRGGSRIPPRQFDHTNDDRLLYLTDRLEKPFGGNMVSWRRAGQLDRAGKKITADEPVPDNVVVTLTPTHLVMKCRNLPNHPTAVFPDRWRALDGNPNFIQEQDFTWHIPLEPRENPAHVAMDATNSNRALPGGAIGVAVNGIILHNPFDERVEMDAVWRTDRCCGHPSPLQAYHYHKYPVCLNTPWADDGEAHSPLIGFMFDGFPVYGPYESAGTMAQHSQANPLNEFNVHFDEARGWHYHVTPGRYPHIAGGFWGDLEMKNRTRRGPPPGLFGPRRPPPGP